MLFVRQNSFLFEETKVVFIFFSLSCYRFFVYVLLRQKLFSFGQNKSCREAEKIPLCLRKQISELRKYISYQSNSTLHFSISINVMEMK